MNNLRARLLDIFERKLQREIGDWDDATRTRIRELWEGIIPAPNCPHSTELVRHIGEVVGEAYNGRSRLAVEKIRAELSGVPDQLLTGMGDSLKDMIVRIFDHEPYIQLFIATPDVYRRKNAPSHKFNRASYDLRLALARVASANSARCAVENACHAIDEAIARADARLIAASCNSPPLMISIVNSSIDVLQIGNNSKAEIS